MSKICQLTGKKYMKGNKVSHSNSKSRRKFLPNLQMHSFFIEKEKKWIRICLSNYALRIINKKGINYVLENIHILKKSK